MDQVKVTWPPFFREMGLRVLEYQERQPELVSLLQDAGIAINHDEGTPLTEIDPFTFFSLVLKHTSEPTALAFFQKLAQQLNVHTSVPLDLTGVPWSNPMNAWFFAYRSERRPQDIPTLWSLTRQALTGVLDEVTFAEALNIRTVALAKLTQGLFWLNPELFLPLNGVNIPYLESLRVLGAARVASLPEYQEVLRAARPFAPDFITLSHTAWLRAQQGKQVAALIDGHFPFEQFRKDAAAYMTDRVKGNMILDRKYAPLLMDLFEAPSTIFLKPSRSPYSGKEQVAVKVALGGGVKSEGKSFGRALMFADNSGFEYVPFPAGLTLEVGWPDGKGDGPRQALQDPARQQQMLTALLAPLPISMPATLTLSTDFGALKLLPLQPEREGDIRATLETYMQGFGKSRRLRVGLTLTPEELESPAFAEHLEAALTYTDSLTGILDALAVAPEIIPAPEVIEVPGQTQVNPARQDAPLPGVALNKILYGPPGTGKTYRVVDEALAILDPAFLQAHPGAEGRAARKARYDDLTTQGRVSFVTFHQSFGYEDFIEGLKPVMDDRGHLTYRIEDGIFLQAVKAAGGLPGTPDIPSSSPTPALPHGVRADGQVWRMYIDGTVPISQVRDLSLTRSELRMGSWGKTPKDLSEVGFDEMSGRQSLFKDSMRPGDLVLLATGQDRIGAIGVVTGDYRFDPHSNPVFALDYAHARPVHWLAQGLNLSAITVTGKQFAQATLQRVKDVTPAQVLAHLPQATQQAKASTGSSALPHVLIIDEINRGNISKIFGELITLLEDSKRAGGREALNVTLPLSRRALSVPRSLYVIGTMNTADRSLTLLDAALRRRFVFRPVWPEPQVLPVLTLPDGTALDLRKLLYAINDRIERLLSREQVIGHAYLLGLPATLDGVAGALRERILPLLEEYFFEDWGKIREVLGDDGKPTELQFLHRVQGSGETRYRLNEDAFGNVDAFTGVYDRLNDADFPFES
ncbi:McrB family protein [Deinococcus malanensis]|nr:McrB family protein [Deinococcus malanensis]